MNGTSHQQPKPKTQASESKIYPNPPTSPQGRHLCKRSEDPEPRVYQRLTPHSPGAAGAHPPTQATVSNLLLPPVCLSHQEAGQLCLQSLAAHFPHPRPSAAAIASRLDHCSRLLTGLPAPTLLPSQQPEGLCELLSQFTTCPFSEPPHSSQGPELPVGSCRDDPTSSLLTGLPPHFQNHQAHSTPGPLHLPHCLASFPRQLAPLGHSELSSNVSSSEKPRQPCRCSPTRRHVCFS